MASQDGGTNGALANVSDGTNGTSVNGNPSVSSMWFYFGVVLVLAGINVILGIIYVVIQNLQAKRARRDVFKGDRGTGHGIQNKGSTQSFSKSRNTSLHVNMLHHNQRMNKR